VHPVTGDEDPVPIGRPIANTRLYVLDADLQPVPVGVTGELYIGGAGVARGYLGQPGLTAERFVVDPFRDQPGARLYRTGDLARYRPDGTLEFLGRADHQVKVRGFRIEPGEIESCLSGHTSVQDAVVVARQDGPDDVRLVAYVTSRAGATPATVEDLRAFAKTRLPDYMVPSHVVVLGALPLTPNGKVDRARLPAPEAAQPPPTPLAAAETDIERTVAAIWEEVLQVPRVGVDQNFFDLGGHSLLTVRVLGRLRETTGRSLPITDRFPTVRALARHLGAGDAPSSVMAASDDRAAARREMMARRRQGRTGEH
jgi:acyl carrier protein